MERSGSMHRSALCHHAYRCCTTKPAAGGRCACCAYASVVQHLYAWWQHLYAWCGGRQVGMLCIPPAATSSPVIDPCKLVSNLEAPGMVSGPRPQLRQEGLGTEGWRLPFPLVRQSRNRGFQPLRLQPPELAQTPCMLSAKRSRAAAIMGQIVPHTRHSPPHPTP